VSPTLAFFVHNTHPLRDSHWLARFGAERRVTISSSPGSQIKSFGCQSMQWQACVDTPGELAWHVFRKME
jgi:hypothetical protein